MASRIHRDDPDRRKKESGADSGSFRKFKNKLAAVRFVDPTGKISKEDLTTYQHMISIVMYNLESAGASLLDTRRMDREMLGLADYLNSAIHSGKAATVKYIVQALMLRRRQRTQGAACR